MLRKRLAKTYIFMASDNIRRKVLYVKECFKIIEFKKKCKGKLCVAGIIAETMTVIKALTMGTPLVTVGIYHWEMHSRN